MIKNYVEKIKKFILNKENKKYTVIGAIVIFTICFFVFDLGGLLGRVFTSIGSLFSNVDGEVKQVVIKSDGYDEGVGGSVQITKSADWIDDKNVNFSYEVKSNVLPSDKARDVVIVLDISSSDSGIKLEDVKNDIKEMVTKVLNDSTNKVSFITFNSSAEIVSNFTNDKNEIINLLNEIELGGESSYYSALLKLDELLTNYNYSNNRELVILFISDGYSTVSPSAAKGQYEIIKEKHPQSLIYGIDYRVGEINLERLKDVSDIQISAVNYDNPLLEPTLNSKYYSTFELVEYINNDYFYIDSSDDITVSVGNVSLINEDDKQKIVWTIDSEYRTGRKETMDIELKINIDLIRMEGLYPILSYSEISYTLANHNLIKLESNETPILKNGYKLIFDENVPSDCNSSLSDKIYYAHDNVDISNKVLECDGWYFQGWESIDDIKYINDTIFVMPNNNITLRAKWMKLYVNKSIEGNVNSGLNLEYTYEYTGNYQEFIAPYTGTYRIELWGAQGSVGDFVNPTNNLEYFHEGGKGAYVSGEINLNKGEKLYVYVGESSVPTRTITVFNNGTPNIGGRNGGGATDIRLVAGEWDDFDSLKSRIMVAGAGGTGTLENEGEILIVGAGGGLVGYPGGKSDSGTQVSAGSPQNSHYLESTFGVANGGCTGGNGYYPAGAAACTNGSGGGSSFISGHNGCDAIDKDSVLGNVIHTGQSIHYSGYRFSNTIMIDGEGYSWTTKKGVYIGMPTHDGKSIMKGNTGSGYAKITFLG